MASLLIRDLDDKVKQRLRVRAAEKGVSMEAEARSILSAAVAEPVTGEEWVRRFRAHFEDIGFADDLVDNIPGRGAEAQISTSRQLPFLDDPHRDASDGRT